MKVRRIRRCRLRDRGRERKNLIFDLNRPDRILSQILRLRGHERSGVTLKVELLRERISLGGVFVCEYVCPAPHPLRLRSIQALYPRMGMRACEQLYIEEIRQQHARSVQGLARVSRYGHLRHRRHCFSDYAEILRRVALPLLGYDLLIALYERIARQMTAAGGKFTHHGLLDVNYRFRGGFDLRLTHPEFPFWPSLRRILLQTGSTTAIKRSSHL